MDKRIGAQLYTVRDFTQTLEDFDKCLEKLSAIGYQAVQLSGTGSFSGEAVKEICDKHHMIPVCTHRPWDEFQNHLEDLIAFHQATDCKIAGLGGFPKLWQNFTKEDTLNFIKEANGIHRKLREHGMSFAYHNHHFEFLKFDGKYVMDYLIEEGEFDFIVDVYWLSYAGIDPARYISKLGKRARVIHFKDLKVVKAEQDREMAEVMEGNLDWDSIIAAAEEAGSEWAMVEQDVCRRDPFDCMQTSYENLKTKGFC